MEFSSHDEIMRRFSEKAPSETLRILIATDNHLGFFEEDPIRGNDSFDTFEEILRTARQGNVDLIILSGDLFHKNRPSRNTVTKTISLLRKYCLGPGDVDIRVKGRFRASKPNIYDENYAVDLPVFVIHGNHDDPTFDGGEFSTTLSPIDVLSEAGLVNYFGWQSSRDSLKVEPVLIEKGDYTKLKLYGIGWIRDDRLHRLFSDEKVAFLDDPQPNTTSAQSAIEGADYDNENLHKASFNIMMIHQNRAHKGRGSKSCFEESMIPEFMDLVIFGHEHECQIEIQSGIDDESRYSLMQPGSSVRTMLSEAEAVPKQIGIMEITMCKDTLEYDTTLTPIPLRTVRPFVMRDITLRNVDSLSQLLRDDVKEADRSAAVYNYLGNQVKTLVAEAREQYAELRPELTRREIKNCRPLIRVRVEHTGFQPINTQVFAQSFLKEVANAADIITFFRSRKTTDSASRRMSGNTVNSAEALMELDEALRASKDLSATARINALVNEVLAQSDDLKVIPKVEFSAKIREFVEKNEPRLIDMYVSYTVKRNTETLLNTKSSMDNLDGGATPIVVQDSVNKYESGINTTGDASDVSLRSITRQPLRKCENLPSVGNWNGDNHSVQGPPRKGSGEKLMRDCETELHRISESENEIENAEVDFAHSFSAARHHDRRTASRNVRQRKKDEMKMSSTDDIGVSFVESSDVELETELCKQRRVASGGKRVMSKAKPASLLGQKKNKKVKCLSLGEDIF